jgi:hypothetical protein
MLLLNLQCLHGDCSHSYVMDATAQHEYFIMHCSVNDGD